MQSHGRVRGKEVARQPRPPTFKGRRIRRLGAPKGVHLERLGNQLAPIPQWHLLPQPDVDAHDRRHVHELVKLQLLEMLRRPVPYHRDVQRLHELDVLLARDDNLVGEDDHQLLLQHFL